jgi:mono/diheme cytochrome c family protein
VQQFVDKFNGFENPTNVTLAGHERANNTVMPVTAYAGMTREDLAAIYAYLRTIKPVTNRIERFPDAK